jgi:hypothetical protein
MIRNPHAGVPASSAEMQGNLFEVLWSVSHVEPPASTRPPRGAP